MSEAEPKEKTAVEKKKEEKPFVFFSLKTDKERLKKIKRQIEETLEE